jgi:hypothetical protein
VFKYISFLTRKHIIEIITLEYKMNTFNNSLPSLLRSFPGIISEESIKQLISDDKEIISYENAAECFSVIDAYKKQNADKTQSRESTGEIDTASKGDFETKGEDDFTLTTMKNHHFANIKFKALVDFAKQDDVFKYNHYAEVDAMRNRAASDIIAKYESEFNSFLISLQGTEGVDKSIINSLVQTKLSVDEIA